MRTSSMVSTITRSNQNRFIPLRLYLRSSLCRTWQNKRNDNQNKKCSILRHNGLNAQKNDLIIRRKTKTLLMVFICVIIYWVYWFMTHAVLKKHTIKIIVDKYIVHCIPKFLKVKEIFQLQFGICCMDNNFVTKVAMTFTISS